MAQQRMYAIFSRRSVNHIKYPYQPTLTQPGLRNRKIIRPDALKAIHRDSGLKKNPDIALKSPNTRTDIRKPHNYPVKSHQGRRRGSTAVAVMMEGPRFGWGGGTAGSVPDWSGGGFKRP